MKEKIYKLIKVFLLTLIISLGMALRSININFPSIGYHNMNENEYLSTAQEMERAHDYSLNRLYCYNRFEKPTERFHPQPPLISYQIILAWKLLDENLWGPRLFNVLFGILSILLFYFLARVLFKNDILVFSSTLLLAVMPLSVFFSRNLQPESPAFFFMVLANLFYLRFVAKFKKYNLFFSGLSLSAACLYKLNFFITLIPFLLCFPFKAFFTDRKQFLKALSVFCLSLSLLVIAALWLSFFNRWHPLELNKIKPLEIFSARYWAEYGRTIWLYTKQENFTIVYCILTFLGIAVAFLKRKGLLNRYIIGWGLAVVFYGMIYSQEIFETNYSQMPFLVLVSVSSIYAIFSISGAVKKIFKIDLLLVFIFITILISSPFIRNSILRMHATVFLGVDVAGESLRGLTKQGDYIFLSTHTQGYGIVRYSQRIAGWTDDLTEFKNKEEEYNVKYACFYPMENLIRLKFENPGLFEYIQKNYHIKEIGLTEEPMKLYYILLERGEGQDIEASLKSFSGIKRISAIYRLVEHDQYIFFYSLTSVLKAPGARE
jgi:hypothetical protein